MSARCDTYDILLFENTECTLILSCEKCYQYRNCDNLLTTKKLWQNVFEQYIIYTDGETP